MEKLFILKQDFQDRNLNPKDQLYYCPHCAMIEGVLSYYPHLREKLEVIYINFPRPRHQLMDLVGEENQGCPNLVISKDISDKVDTGYFKMHGDYLFVNQKELIAQYLADRFKIAIPHP